jgi:choline kinase
LVIYADIFFEENAINLITQSQAPSVLNVVNWESIWNLRFENPMNDLENFRFDKDTFLLTQIGGRVQYKNHIQGQFGGMFTITPQLWELMVLKIPNLKLIDTTSAFQKAIENGAYISTVDYDGVWAEFDTVDDLNRQI